MKFLDTFKLGETASHIWGRLGLGLDWCSSRQICTFLCVQFLNAAFSSFEKTTPSFFPQPKSNTMICIECTEPVHSLYTQYSPSNIRLTACRRCNKFADKYIEYDSVLVFVDVILLKPQAYRHLVFNVFTPEKQVWGSPPVASIPISTSEEVDADDDTTEKSDEKALRRPEDDKIRIRKRNNMSKESEPPSSQSSKHPSILSSSSSPQSKQSLRQRDRPKSLFSLLHIPIISGLHVQAQRMWLLVTLFDVYLTWARAEQNRALDARFHKILEYPVLAQYSSFLVLCLVESLTTHCVLRAFAIYWLKWRGYSDKAAAAGTLRTKEKDVDKNSASVLNAAKAALSTALLISSSSKLFPILMVIWSYDVPFAATVLGWAISFNTIEALTIILQCGYLKACFMTAVAAFLRNQICDNVVLPLVQMFWKYIMN